MADQIFADGPIDAPAIYTVPGSSEIIPIAVQAVLDGTAASGTFVPTLIFRSQAGHVIARVPTSTTVAAGGSAEVSWFPNGMTAAATVASTGLAVAYVSRSSNTALGPGTVQPVWDQFHTNDATVFSWNAGDHRFVNCTTPGQFLIGNGADWHLPPVTITSPVSASATGFDSVINVLAGVVGFTFDIEDASVADPKEVGSVSGWDLVPAHGFSPPLTFFTSLTLGAAQTFDGFSMMIIRLATV